MGGQEAFQIKGLPESSTVIAMRVFSAVRWDTKGSVTNFTATA
jgi:hypothetical protein